MGWTPCCEWYRSVCRRRSPTLTKSMPPFSEPSMATTTAPGVGAFKGVFSRFVSLYMARTTVFSATAGRGWRRAEQAPWVARRGLTGVSTGAFDALERIHWYRQVLTPIFVVDCKPICVRNCPIAPKGAHATHCGACGGWAMGQCGQHGATLSPHVLCDSFVFVADGHRIVACSRHAT